MAPRFAGTLTEIQELGATADDTRDDYTAGRINIFAPLDPEASPVWRRILYGGEGPHGGVRPWAAGEASRWAEAVRARPGGGHAPFAFPDASRFCVARFCGRAGRLNTENAGFRPLVPPPVWSTIHLLLQNCKKLLVPVLPY